MLEYFARASFKIGERVVNTGESLRLSTHHAARIAQRGYLLEKSVVGLHDVAAAYESRIRILVEKFQYSHDQASKKAMNYVQSLLIRHESLKSFTLPTPEFLQEVEEFNQSASGTNPITKIQSDKGAGEWAGYNCNIGSGCSHGCLYCYAEKIATRFNRIDRQDAWQEEKLRDVTTAKCKKYNEPIMFATTHDITPAYLKAYRCHLYNIIVVGNQVILVTKPHRESIISICTEFSSFRDNITFRFSIGGLDDESLRLWEPGAPSLSERMWCLQYAFESGFKTSVSAEPMLSDRHGAERLYNAVEPFVTEDIWFGKMNNLGGFRNSDDPEVASRAAALYEAYSNSEIMKLVESIGNMPKVMWKDSVTEVIEKHGQRGQS